MPRNTSLYIFLSLVLFVNCFRLPPGNAYYASMANTTNKLNLVASLGPYQLENVYNNFSGEHEIFFLPDKNNITTGFIVIRTNSNFSILYSDVIGLSESFHCITDSIDTENPDYWIDTIDGFSGSLLFLKYQQDGIEYDIIQRQPGNSAPISLHGSQSLNNQIFSDLNGAGYTGWTNQAPTVKGAFLSPINQKLYFLCKDNSNVNNNFYECNYQIENFQLTSLELTYSNIFLPINTISNRIHYFYDFTHKSSYAGIFDEHITYSWDENYTLSTSLLLSGTPNYLISDSFLALVQDKIMSIYNYNGENIQSLFTGDIRFICETQNEAGKGQLFFSYCLLLNDNDVMEFYFYLYSIPTEEFIKL